MIDTPIIRICRACLEILMMSTDQEGRVGYHEW